MASKAVVGRLAVLCRMLPGSEYLLLRCRVQGRRGSKRGVYGDREKKGERKTERAKEREREREGAYTQEKERGKGLVYKRREVGEREGKEPGGGTPENGLAQLRRLAGGESAG